MALSTAHMDRMTFDAAGRIARENQWLDLAAIQAQLPQQESA